MTVLDLRKLATFAACSIIENIVKVCRIVKKILILILYCIVKILKENVKEIDECLPVGNCIFKLSSLNLFN